MGAIINYRFKEMVITRRSTVTATDTEETGNVAVQIDSNSGSTPITPTTDVFENLPPTILLEILSYLHLQDYRDLARLRQISKGMKSILPQYIREAMPYSLCSLYEGTLTVSDFINQLMDAYTAEDYYEGDRTMEECGFDGYIGATFDIRTTKNEKEGREKASTDTDSATATGNATETKESLFLFQGCQHQMVTMVTNCSDSTYKNAISPSNTITGDDEKEREYARLCQEILGAKSLESFQTLSKEAAMKGMFLPMPPLKNSHNDITTSKGKGNGKKSCPNKDMCLEVS